MSKTDKVKKPLLPWNLSKMRPNNWRLRKAIPTNRRQTALGVSLSAFGRWVRTERPQSAVSGVKAQAINLAAHES